MGPLLRRPRPALALLSGDTVVWEDEGTVFTWRGTRGGTTLRGGVFLDSDAVVDALRVQ